MAALVAEHIAVDVGMGRGCTQPAALGPSVTFQANVPIVVEPLPFAGMKPDEHYEPIKLDASKKKAGKGGSGGAVATSSSAGSSKGSAGVGGTYMLYGKGGVPRAWSLPEMHLSFAPMPSGDANGEKDSFTLQLSTHTSDKLPPALRDEIIAARDTAAVFDVWVRDFMWAEVQAGRAFNDRNAPNSIAALEVMQRNGHLLVQGNKIGNGSDRYAPSLRLKMWGWGEDITSKQVEDMGQYKICRSYTMRPRVFPRDQAQDDDSWPWPKTTQIRKSEGWARVTLPASADAPAGATIVDTSPLGTLVTYSVEVFSNKVQMTDAQGKPVFWDEETRKEPKFRAYSPADIDKVDTLEVASFKIGSIWASSIGFGTTNSVVCVILRKAQKMAIAPSSSAKGSGIPMSAILALQRAQALAALAPSATSPAIPTPPLPPPAVDDAASAYMSALAENGASDEDPTAEEELLASIDAARSVNGKRTREASDDADNVNGLHAKKHHTAPPSEGDEIFYEDEQE